MKNFTVCRLPFRLPLTTCRRVWSLTSGSRNHCAALYCRQAGSIAAGFGVTGFGVTGFGVTGPQTHFVKFIGNGQARLRCASGGRVSQMEGIPVHQAKWKEFLSISYTGPTYSAIKSPRP